MESLVIQSNKANYAQKLGEARCNHNPNIIDVHTIPYYERKLKEEYWKEFQQEQGKKYMEHLDKEVYNLFGKALEDLFEGWKK